MGNVLWLLPTPRQTQYHASVVFEARRPWSGTQTRWHCGVDVRATKGMPVLAPEDLVIVAADRGWQGSAKATLVHTTSGRSLLLGCTALGTSPAVGTLVKAGAELARVGAYDGGSSMVHFQLYDAKITPAQANMWQSWKVGNARPPHLIDPMPYLLGAHEEPAPQPASESGGGRTDVNPCARVDGQLVCMLPDVTAWIETARKDIERTQATLSTLNAAPDEIWTDVETVADARFLNDALSVYVDEVEGKTEKLGANERVTRLVAAVKVAVETRKIFEHALARGGAKKKTGGGGGGGLVVLPVGVGAIGLALMAVSRRRRRRR